MSNLLTTNANAAPAQIVNQPGDVFMNIASFEAAQRMAKPLAESNLVPETFKGKIGDCIIALEMAQRIGASPLAVMQNLYIVHGKPAWSSQFLIACINASGKFTPLRYEMIGEKGTDSFGCVAWAQDRSGERLDSPPVTIGMAKAEGWFTKNGSKWKTMPELMLRYRAATLFARLYSPELTMGINTEDEVIDITPIVTEPVTSKFDAPPKAARAPMIEVKEEPPSDLELVAAEIDKRGIPLTAEEIKKFVEGQGEMFCADMVIPIIDDIANKILAGGE